MREDDDLILECLEDIYREFDGFLSRVQKVRSVHVVKLESIAEELRSHRRIFEDISFPARLIVEQLLITQFKSGQVAIEGEHLSQSYASVRAVKVEGFGIIRVQVGELEIKWRDSDYSYYLYPDKVELRAADEKSAIKVFFTLGFVKQTVERFPEILTSPNVHYVHPQLERWLGKVQ